MGISRAGEFDPWCGFELGVFRLSKSRQLEQQHKATAARIA